MVRVAPKDYVASITLRPAEAICWTDSETSGKYESFTLKKTCKYEVQV